MDYPKSVPSVGLVNGKFVDEDIGAGTTGSLIPSKWGNAVTDEILNVIAAAELTPDEENNGQLLAAVSSLIDEAVVNTGRLLAVRTFTDTGPYVPTAGMRFVRVRAQGGSGSSGGTPATGASQVAISGSSGSGAFAEGVYTAEQIGAGVPVTIGAAGPAAAVGLAGLPGGTTSFGTFLTAPGSPGGPAGTAVSTSGSLLSAGGSGAVVATGGIVNKSGAQGLYGTALGSSILAGRGGDSEFGTGGSQSASAVTGTGFGAGSSGQAVGPSNAARSGAVGLKGFLEIEEWA